MRATSRLTTAFIDVLVERMSFRIEAMQRDGSSEFQDLFKSGCRKQDFRLFELPPRSLKLNGHVELRTHTEECYEFTDLSLDFTALNKALPERERIHDTVRPHQYLG